MLEFDLSFRRGSMTIAGQAEVRNGITALFGPSGSGKTTLLNLLAGLLRPDRGFIRCGGTPFFDTAACINLPVHQRRIGYVFQDALLFPHLSVHQNLLYGHRQEAGNVADIATFFGIDHLLQRAPATLSGGERQRVAIGRAVLSAPQLMLMDEPLASLDLDRKQEILPYIAALPERFNLPVVYVSHAVEEVLHLAQQVLVIKEGQIVERGPPQEIMAHSPLLSRFEQSSILTGTPVSFDPAYGLSALHHPAGTISVATHLPLQPQPLRLTVRATDVTLATSKVADVSTRTLLQGQVKALEAGSGPVATAIVTLLGGEELAVALTRKAIADLGLAPGKPVWCLLKSVSIDERWLTPA
jgi:molybdate transport system ATP-binding protein